MTPLSADAFYIHGSRLFLFKLYYINHIHTVQRIILPISLLTRVAEPVTVFVNILHFCTRIVPPSIATIASHHVFNRIWSLADTVYFHEQIFNSCSGHSSLAHWEPGQSLVFKTQCEVLSDHGTVKSEGANVISSGGVISGSNRERSAVKCSWRLLLQSNHRHHSVCVILKLKYLHS